MSKFNSTDNLDESVNLPVPSKSQRKREMIALQELGEKLVNIKATQLNQLNLPEQLLEAILLAKQITKHEAKRRQLQYIGRIMRNVDATPIANALASLDSAHRQLTSEFHLVEDWRERLLTEDKAALTAFLSENPQTDSQHLRQLIKHAVNERKTGNPKGAARALFRYLNSQLKTKNEHQ